MKKIASLFLVLLLFANAATAQSPQKFSFQGVARDANGKILTGGSSVNAISFAIHKGSANGSVEYKEVHTNVMVSDGGIFNVQIGAGNQVLTGDMSLIDWSIDTYFLQIQFTLNDGQVNDLGAVQLLSVPYALHSNVAGSWKQDTPIVQFGSYGNGPTLGSIGDGSRLIWYPRKAAFLAGLSLESIWNDANIGQSSIALGSHTIASGESSAAIGKGTLAKAFGSFSVGAFNNSADNPSNDFAGMAATDRVFQVGNGSNDQSPSNALTILRNGNVGIGNNVLAPTVPLEVGGRLRIHHNINSTAGIHLDNSTNNTAGFVGMINDDKVGFYIGNKWRFQVTGDGFVGIGSNVVNPTYPLEVGGRARIYHSGATAGIHFDNSSNTPTGFIGMITDNKMGLYIGDKWLLHVADNGNIGIGAGIDIPAYPLDLDGRARVRHKGATAGIHFDNSTGTPTGFVGMVNDNKVGLYIGNKWALQVNDLAGVTAGTNTTTYGTNALAIGNGTWAEGNESAALGEGTIAKAWGATTIGTWNNVQDNPVGTKVGLKATDRIFQIGNGTAANNLSNAFTVLRNGNVGIGNESLLPSHILDVGGRARMRHNGNTAGIYFDNSQNNSVGFVGMSGDNSVGLYIGNQWKLQIFGNGGTLIEGNLGVNGIISESSDRRLKRDFSPISSSLGKLINLKGYHYYWKDKDRDQSLQTGLIAQDVEALFPELVKTDDKGFKSLNYTGLIPHLIESVKELVKQNARLEAENAGFRAESKEINDKLAAIASRLDQLATSRSEAMTK